MKENATRGAYQARPHLAISYRTWQTSGYRSGRGCDCPYDLDKYVNGKMNFFDIARYLNSLGLKTSHGKAFERRSIEYIIQNPSYCGMIRWNRMEKRHQPDQRPGRVDHC